MKTRNPEEDLAVIAKLRPSHWIIADDGYIEKYVCGVNFGDVGRIDDRDDAEFITMAHEALPWYIQRYQRMQGLLRNIEWDGEDNHCPYCGGPKPYVDQWNQDIYGGHCIDCELAALLEVSNE